MMSYSEHNSICCYFWSYNTASLLHFPQKNIPKIRAEEHYLILPDKTSPKKKVGDYYGTKDLPIISVNRSQKGF